MQAQRELEELADVPLEVRAEADRTILKVREIVRLRVDSVIRTRTRTQEGVRVLVGGVVVGTGQLRRGTARRGVRITSLGPES